MSDTPIYDEVCAVLLFTPDLPARLVPAPSPTPRPQAGKWFRAPADSSATQTLPVIPAGVVS